ncbi:ABC transporter substrate-binding protein [Pseudonocardia kunmingensis]|nr:ABC transporter substrate-binding protein [Pseudonocardia kunmingensis]
MTNRRRRIGAALALATALLVTACGGGGGGAEAGTLRVASNSNLTALPFWVAQEQGLFEKHGLQIEYTKIENVATLPQALGTSFDIVLSTPTLAISSTAQGIPMVEVAGSSVDTEANPSNFLMVAKDSGITDVTQLPGKTIGVLNETGTLHVATLYWLQKSGVDPKSVKIVQVDGPSQADQLRSGRVDAVETVTPFSGQIESVGGVSLGTPYRSMALEISPIYWASREDWADGHDADIDKFVAALDEAQQYIAANDGAARDVLQDQTGYSDEIVASIPFPTYNTDVRQQDVALWLEAMRSATGFTGDVDPAALVHQPNP